MKRSDWVHDAANKIISDYQALRDDALEIAVVVLNVQRPGTQIGSFPGVEFWNDPSAQEGKPPYTTVCVGWTSVSGDPYAVTFPISYLWSDSVVTDETAAESARIAEREALRLQTAQLQTAEHEERERATYERLRAKFDPGMQRVTVQISDLGRISEGPRLNLNPRLNDNDDR